MKNNSDLLCRRLLYMTWHSQQGQCWENVTGIEEDKYFMSSFHQWSYIFLSFFVIQNTTTLLSKIEMFCVILLSKKKVLKSWNILPLNSNDKHALCIIVSQNGRDKYVIWNTNFVTYVRPSASWHPLISLSVHSWVYLVSWTW